MLQEMRQWLRDTRLQRRVRRIIVPALAGLDRIEPKWANYIKYPVRLNSDLDCIIGQVFGSFHSGIRNPDVNALVLEHPLAFGCSLDQVLKAMAGDAMLNRALEARWEMIARGRRDTAVWHSTPTHNVD